MIAQEIATRIEPLVQQLVDKEVARLIEPTVRRRTAAELADAQIMAAAKTVGTLTDRLQQACYAGKGEIAARKALLLANLRLATVMRRHGRMT